MTVCIYHKNCNDGSTAAAILLTKFPDCKLFAFDHGYKDEDMENLLNNIEEGDTVYIVDFALRSEKDYEKIFQKAKEIINLDHHITVKDKLQQIAQKYPNFKFIFDNNKSGASITWQYLYGDNYPEFVKLVEDKDIWKWEYGEKTKYLNAFLTMYTDKPEEIKNMLNQDINELLEKGKIISDYNDFLINRFVEKAKELPLKIGDYIVKGYNACLFQSEIGNLLSTQNDQAVALFNFSGTNVKLSFRSLDHHNPSAADLAQILGGGGHRNASGAMITVSEFIKLINI